MNNPNMTGNAGTTRQNPLMRRLQELTLAMTDVGLFLDTHPENSRALQNLRRLSDEYERVAAEYERRYGGLTQAGAVRVGKDAWNWTETPFPWESETEGGR